MLKQQKERSAKGPQTYQTERKKEYKVKGRVYVYILGNLAAGITTLKNALWSINVCSSFTVLGVTSDSGFKRVVFR